ncbi:MAG: 3-deoxy-7-phosphoheptulonate synthase, partial [Colwelliaceae bacterium]|nr:3-deoxy-7-phosphoheptulonate synthase [Colwelliaceae bacterium]
TTESQVHRELASALSCPVGFKNGTDGNIQIAVDAIKASSVPHVLYSPNKSGQMCIYQTHGNPHAHVILRGGKEPNYHAKDIENTLNKLAKNDINAGIMIDCSHGNSYKDHNKQIDVAQSVADQIASGRKGISGVMVESFLVQGNQKVIDKQTLTYGQSITDACVDLSVSENMLTLLSSAIKQSRS